MPFPELVPDHATAPAREEPRRTQCQDWKAHREEIDRDLVKELNAAGVPCGLIYSIDQMFEYARGVLRK